MSLEQEPDHHENSAGSDTDDDNEELFAAVLSTLDLRHLPQLAGSVRRRTDHSVLDPVVGSPFYGSYHVLFPLDFEDGARWLAKIPVNGTSEKWNTMSATSLTSEARTMQMLKQETTIPLPEVFDFSATTASALRCPYILISFIQGVSLYGIWFDKTNNPDVVRNHRTRALKGIAAAMLQLEKFSFHSAGAIGFDEDGKIAGIGPLREVDNKAMLDRWFVHKDPDDDPIYVQAGPFSDQKEYYTYMLELHPETKPFPKGSTTLLRHLISWIPEPEGGKGFVLTHPDFDIQNIIVSEEGELAGLIDWDGVAAVPRTIGNERYPGWLTRDWDPAMYSYKKSMDEGVEPEGVWEDSPEQLAYYRSLYNEVVQKALISTSNSKTSLTQISLITDNLAIAVRDPKCRNAILEKIIQEINRAFGSDVELSFFDIATKFGEDGVDEATMEQLKKGFTALLYEVGYESRTLEK